MKSRAKKNAYRLENTFFRLLFSADCSMELLEKKSGHSWYSAHPFQLIYGNIYSYDLAAHCRMRVKRESNRLEIRFSEMDWKARFPEHTYRKPDPGPDVRFHFSIELIGDRIIFTTGRISGIDSEEYLLKFPCRLLSWKCTDQLDVIIPRGYGQLVDYPREGEYFDFGWGYSSLPLYGVMRKDGGIGVRLLDPCDHRNQLHNGTGGRNMASLDTAYLFNRNFANYPRRTVWKYFSAGSGFVSLAKWYRAEKIREKAFVSLTEKIRKNPAVEKLVGAVIWKHSVFSQKKMPPGIQKGYSLYALKPEVEIVEGKPDCWNAYELFDRAHELGFDRFCVYNTGWNHAGFDSGYPTRFPVNPERGTEKDFSAAAEYARTLSKDYIYSVHDNYTDIYSNSSEPFEHSVRVARNGAPVEGGIWRGGRAKIQCTAVSRQYARRDIPRIARMVGPGSIYIDVMGAAALQECYSSEHPASRRKDLKNRRSFMLYVKRIMGSLASEAVPCDAIADILDLGAYMGPGLELEFPGYARKATVIPLWQLVYHDSVLGFTNAYNDDSVRNYYAFCALFGLLPGGLDETSLRFSRQLRKTYCSEMTDFQILQKNGSGFHYVAESIFSDGTRVVANLTDSNFHSDKISLPPHSFEIFSPDISISSVQR